MNDIFIDIAEENALATYTDDHFINKLNADLEKIRIASMGHKDITGGEHDDSDSAKFNWYRQNGSNSPVIMSANNSDSETDEQGGIKRLTFREVRDSIYKYYDVKCTTEFDLITTYLKCQKQLYAQSAIVSGYKLRVLIVPAFVGGISITVFAPFLMQYSWSGAAISALNVFVLSIFFAVYYFDFLPALTFYMQIAKQFEKMENISESAGNQYGFLEKSVDKSEYVLENLRCMEKKYMDLKEIMIMDIPVEVRRAYPIGHHISIFSFIKKIETNKKTLIVQLKDVKNEMRYIEWKSEQEDAANKYRMRMDFLCETKEKLRVQIMNYCNAYSCMEDMLSKEFRRGFSICFINKKWSDCENPVVKSYCESIFEDD